MAVLAPKKHQFAALVVCAEVARFVHPLWNPPRVRLLDKRCRRFFRRIAFEDGEPLPIGFPCENTRITLVDGEICVSGTCLSAGYYNAPEKTAAAFVQQPDARGIPERMYKTGDLSGSPSSKVRSTRYHEQTSVISVGPYIFTKSASGKNGRPRRIQRAQRTDVSWAQGQPNQEARLSN